MSDPVIKLAARGEGITASGAFLPGVAPGDAVEADGSITRGPHWQQAACKHYGKCGGCQLQHIDDTAFVAFAVDRITAALHAQGLDTPEIRTPHLSPPGTRRRVALKVLRQGKRIILGFNEGGSHNLVDLGQCLVMHPALFALIAPLRALLASLMKDRRPAEVRMTLTDQGVDLMIAGGEAEGLAAIEALADFAARHKLARLSLDEGYGPQVRWQPEPVTITLGTTPVELPEGAFLQATADGEAALTAAVREAVGDAAEVVDLFAGLGTFSLAVPGRVHAVEGARDAILALQSAANRTRLLLTAEHRDLFRRPLTAKELARFDAIILDPPRAGAKEQVVEMAKSEVPVIASISCNPATFARDAKLLCEGGYRLDWIAPVGQFRWSTHVELAAQFTRAG